MRRSLPVLAVLLTTSLWLRAAAPTGIAPPNAPKSIFAHQQHEPGFGKDPFFPRTERFTKVATVDPESVRPNVPDTITLKGISFVQGKKLAIINNYTVAEGEEFSARSGGQALKVKCVEIKERSVMIQVNGVSKELSMRAGLN